MSEQKERLVDEAVRSVPGVVRLYAPAGLVRGARALLDAENATMSVVRVGDDGELSATVTVGLSTEADPVAVSGEIVAAVRAVVGETAHVSVRIGRAIG